MYLFGFSSSCLPSLACLNPGPMQVLATQDCMELVEVTRWRRWHDFQKMIRFELRTSRPWPIGSIYGIFTYIWLIFMVNVGKYTIHGWYGWWNEMVWSGTSECTSEVKAGYCIKLPKGLKPNQICGSQIYQAFGVIYIRFLPTVCCFNHRFKYFLCFIPTWGNYPTLTSMFQRGWNHQLVMYCTSNLFSRLISFRKGFVKHGLIWLLITHSIHRIGIVSYIYNKNHSR